MTGNDNTWGPLIKSMFTSLDFSFRPRRRNRFTLTNDLEFDVVLAILFFHMGFLFVCFHISPLQPQKAKIIYLWP